MSKKDQPWQPSDVETLLHMRALGHTYKEISDALARPFQSVTHKYQRLPREAIPVERNPISLGMVPNPKRRAA